MIIYEGYFNDKQPDNDDIISDVENKKNDIDYKYYLEIQYLVKNGDSPDFNKNYRRLNYLFSQIDCISEFNIEIDEKLYPGENSATIFTNVYFNVEPSSNYKDFNRFIYALKHNLAHCLDCALPITRSMIGSIGSVNFCYANDEPILKNHNTLAIGNYPYRTLYYSDIHIIYQTLFPKNKDMHKLDSDDYARQIRQHAYEKVISLLNDCEEVKNAGVYFIPVNISLDDSLKIYVTNSVNFISLEVHPLTKKTKRIDIDDLARIMDDCVLSKISLNIERTVGYMYLIVKPVDMSVKIFDDFEMWKGEHYLKHKDFGNTQTVSYHMPKNSHFHLLVTRKDGTTIPGSKISSSFSDIVGCVNLGLCWKPRSMK